MQKSVSCKRAARACCWSFVLQEGAHAAAYHLRYACGDAILELLIAPWVGGCREEVVASACGARSLVPAVEPRGRALREARLLCTGRCPSCAVLQEVGTSSCALPEASFGLQYQTAGSLSFGCPCTPQYSYSLQCCSGSTANQLCNKRAGKGTHRSCLGRQYLLLDGSALLYAYPCNLGCSLWLQACLPAFPSSSQSICSS